MHAGTGRYLLEKKSQTNDTNIFTNNRIQNTIMDAKLFDSVFQLNLVSFRLDVLSIKLEMLYSYTIIFASD